MDYFSQRQFKEKIKKWNLEKKINGKTALAMLQIERKRKVEKNKPTSFTYKGRPVDEKNLERTCKRLKVNGQFSEDYSSVGKFGPNPLINCGDYPDVVFF